MNHTFNYYEYILIEVDKGKQYSMIYDLYEMNGFHSTLLYNKYINESLSYYTHYYNSSECYNDSILFKKWITLIKKYDDEHPTNYIEMCNEYQQYVQQLYTV